MSTFQEDRAYSAHEVTRKNAYNQEGTANLSSQQPVAIGFVYQQPSQQSFNNPYVTQEAHNPSYKSTSHHISPNSTPYIHGNTQNGGSHRIEDGCVWSTSTRTYYTSQYRNSS